MRTASGCDRTDAMYVRNYNFPVLGMPCSSTATPVTTLRRGCNACKQKLFDAANVRVCLFYTLMKRALSTAQTL
jgi:hypothetical protein